MKQFLIYFAIATVGFLLIILAFSNSEKLGFTATNEIELRYEENYSLTYPEAISAYQQLDKRFSTAKLITYGPTDFGIPLHLFVISKSKIFNPEKLREKGFRIVLVNNGIHPGEPCGIDASIKLARDILNKKDGLWEIMDSTVLCIVPVYNIGGAHNRSPYNRANQVGPQEQGFRANAKNLDLNRDWAPMTSRNAQSFAKIFHLWKPNILIDTHTTNGADYQYVMTLIPSHPNELPPMLGDYYDKVMEPFLYLEMERSGYEMIPYVSPMGQTPESGLQQYYNPIRYTTGYGRAFNTITLMTEAHMFKPFRDRVLATYEFIKATIDFTSTNGARLKALREQADSFIANKMEYTLHWELDTTKVEQLSFKGYEAELIDSDLTGGKRLRYDRDMPFTKDIPYYRYYIPTLTIMKPDYYIIPQAWHEVIHRLQINDVKMHRFERDTVLEVEAYYITDYKSIKNWNTNGHNLHSNVQVRSEKQLIQFYEGDYIVPTNQPTNQYIVEMLEPQGYDSFFTWNFFDSVLQRKEYFSPYVFEDYAKMMLDNDAELKEAFEAKKREDKEFASNPYAQLSYLYQLSPYFEKTYMRYPIFRSVSS